MNRELLKYLFILFYYRLNENRQKKTNQKTKPRSPLGIAPDAGHSTSGLVTLTGSPQSHDAYVNQAVRAMTKLMEGPWTSKQRPRDTQ